MIRRPLNCPTCKYELLEAFMKPCFQCDIENNLWEPKEDKQMDQFTRTTLELASQTIADQIQQIKDLTGAFAINFFGGELFTQVNVKKFFEHMPGPYVTELQNSMEYPLKVSQTVGQVKVFTLAGPTNFKDFPEEIKDQFQRKLLEMLGRG